LKKTALLACALIVSSTTFASARELRGCVELRNQADGGKCLMLKSTSGEFFALKGTDLPPAFSGSIIAVTGTVKRGGCPLRITSREVAVKKWVLTRANCPRT
jgi:hypothetical protein